MLPIKPFIDPAVHNQIKNIVIKSRYGARVICPLPVTPFPIKYFKEKWKHYSSIRKNQLIEGLPVYCPRYIALPRMLFYSVAGTMMYSGIKNTAHQIYKQYGFDLIHSHHGYPDGFAAYQLSKKYQKPFVVTLRGTDLDIIAHKSYKMKIILETIIKEANRVVVPSPRLANTCYDLFGIMPITVSNGLNTSDIFEGESRILEQYGRPIILSISQLIPSKGIDLTLYALKSLKSKYPGLQYLIIGDGPSRNDLQKLIVELGLENNVKLLGYIEHKHAMEYMSICDIFVLPSWQETFGLVYTEAMAHAKPVIGVLGQGIDGVVTSGYDGILVKPKDVSSLVEALDYLLSNESERNEIGIRARQLVLNQYTWDKNALQIISIYEELVLNNR